MRLFHLPIPAGTDDVRPARPRHLAVMGLVAVMMMTVGCSDDPSPAQDTSEDDGTSDVVGDVVGTDTEDDVMLDTAAPVTLDDGDSPGLGIDYGAGVVAPLWEPDGDSWTRVGWPSNRDLVDGRVTLERFPQNGTQLLATYVEYGSTILDGFGLNGAIYFQLNGALSVESLPRADASTAPTSAVQLVDVTKDSPEYGRRFPLVFRWYGDGTDKYYEPNTLGVRPVYGFPLREGTTYCAVVTRAVTDADGTYLAAAAGYPDALLDAPWMEPFIDWMADSPLRFDDIATATCFTTQTGTREMTAVAAWITDQAPPEVDSVSEPRIFNEFHGRYTAPNFQSGDKPYETQGGALQFDTQGAPVPQTDEEIRFLLRVPRDAAMPPAGWPVVHYAHGTGGDYQSCEGVADDLNDRGLAVICIDQPLHGFRGPAGRKLSDDEQVLFSFNFVNPAAGRTNFRQAAFDTLVLTRMIEAGRFDVPPGATTSGDGVVLDPSRITFFGHSHGGLSGALAIAVDDRIDAAVLSGAAGILTETVMRRIDPVDLRTLVRALLGVKVDDFDTFHPTMTLLQTLVEITDPVNYAPAWIGGPLPPKHVFVTEGTNDHASPAVGTDALAAAAGLPIITPLAKHSEAHVLGAIDPLEMPVAGNVDGVTGALRQWPGGSHFVAFSNSEARSMWQSFFEGYVTDGLPVLSAPTSTSPRPGQTRGADTCADAVALPNDLFPVITHGNTSLAAPDHATAGCGSPEAGASGRDLAYRFTAPETGTYRFRVRLPAAIDQNTPRFGPRLLYVVGDCADLTGSCLGRDNDIVDVDLEAGANVVAIVDGSTADDRGPFTLEVDQRCIDTPCGERECGTVGCASCGACANDERCTGDGQCEPLLVGDRCEAPIVVDTLPFTTTGDTRPYQGDYGFGAQDCPGFAFAMGFGSDDVAFAVDAPTTGRYVATLSGTYDAALFVTTDCDDIPGTCLGADRRPSASDRVTFDLAAGERAFVIVDGVTNSSNRAGFFGLTIDACVPDCANHDCGDDGCGGSCGACGAGSHCADTSSCEPIPYVCEGGQTCVETTPGDRCETPITIETLPFETSDGTFNYTPDYGFSPGACPGIDGGWGRGASDVAYAFSAPETGLYHFQLQTGTNFDATLYLVEDCEDIDGSCIAGDDRTKNDFVWREFEAGDEAFVIVDGWTNFSEHAGSYSLNVRQCVPSCEGKICGTDGCLGQCGGPCSAGERCAAGICVDDFGTSCASPRTVPANLPFGHSGDTTPTADFTTSPCGSGAGDGANDYTYRFTAPRAGTYRFGVTADWDAFLYITDECSGGSSCIAETTDTVEVDLAVNQVVFLVVDGAIAGQGGPFSLLVSEVCTPECDGLTCGDNGCGGLCGECTFPADICRDGSCAAPDELPGNTCTAPFAIGALPFIGAGNTGDAENHYVLGAEDCDNVVYKGVATRDQVWRFDPPAAGTYRASLTASGFDSALYVVGDCSDISGSCVAANDADRVDEVTFTAGGDPLFIIVDGVADVADESGAYELRVEAATP